MGLKDHFRRDKGMPKEKVAADFWEQVSYLCDRHVQGMIEFFTERNAPLMDWATSRFRALVSDEAREALVAEARTALRESPGQGAVFPRILDPVDGWFACVSVIPSASDADFLAACPDGSYERLAESFRADLRAALNGWDRWDVAHWILLLDEPGDAASIHLHTIWAYLRVLQWVMKAPSRTQVPMPPTIIPMDLLKEDPFAFIRRLQQSDAEWSLSRSQATQGDTGK